MSPEITVKPSLLFTVNLSLREEDHNEHNNEHKVNTYVAKRRNKEVSAQEIKD